MPSEGRARKVSAAVQREPLRAGGAAGGCWGEELSGWAPGTRNQQVFVTKTCQWQEGVKGDPEASPRTPVSQSPWLALDENIIALIFGDKSYLFEILHVPELCLRRTVW